MMTIPFQAADWNAVMPIAVLAVASLVVLLADLIAPKNVNRYVAIVLGCAGAIAAGVLAAEQFGHNYNAFFGGFMTGGFTTVFEEIILAALVGSLILYGTLGSRRARRRNHGAHAVEHVRCDADGRCPRT